MFKPVSNKVSFPEMEKDILAFWEKHQTFKRSLEQRKNSPEYVFYDGPPFATGLPHYGHLLAGTIKDIVPRYHTMRGHYVERRFGWDCHGLPVEFEMEQELKISGKRDIEKLGIDVFNEKCRSIVLRYTQEWRQVVTRMGRWVDFDHDYKTMDLPFMESIWWVFKSLWEKELIYEGNKILPYCPRCATPLSNFETNQGYKDVQDPAITVRFRIKHSSDASLIGGYLLVWTTTPWTLPANLALCVGPNVEYVHIKVKESNEHFILSSACLSKYFPKADLYEVLGKPKGRDISGLQYEPIFPYYATAQYHPEQCHLSKISYPVLKDEFVSTEEGTGIVHLAPAYGEDDNRICARANIKVVDPLDAECRFIDPVTEYKGMFCKDADSLIIKRLKDENKLQHRSTIQHSYPHCWRCDSPLIFKPVPTWFVRVEQLREKLLATNAQTRWNPEHLRDGRFGKWLEGARDWAISRNRYWGTPIPVWKSEDGKDVLCIGSVAELEKLTGSKVGDLHKHKIDPLVIQSNGKTYRRVPQVLDCWFESGSMPYAQSHYPFENKERFESHFPADFIAEGLDQTRGWFYTLTVLSTALFNKPAFKNVIVNGLVLAEDGRKMSKRLKNYPDPSSIFDNYGADALRLYLINSPVVRAEDFCFSEEGVKQSLRHLLIPWWNAYSFFVTYARIDGWSPKSKVQGSKSENLLDRWILSAMERLNHDVVKAMDGYDLQQAVRPFVQFIEDLTNWYIRRSRRRFWKSSNDEDKLQAYATLYDVLIRLSKIAAPFTPFISETIYQNLKTEEMPESVHLCDFPQANEAARDLDLETQMEEVILVTSLARQLRTEYNLKVRQPLHGLHVVSRNEQRLKRIEALKDIIKDELNVREVWFSTHETELATLSAKANFSKLGRQLGSLMKKAAEKIQQLGPEDLETLNAGGQVTVEFDGQNLVLGKDDVLVTRTPKADLAVAASGDIVVALETKLDDELIQEGLAREFVNKVQTMRKTADLDIAQRIHLAYQGEPDVRVALEKHKQYIETETLAQSLEFKESLDGTIENVDLNGKNCAIQLRPL